MHFWLWFNLIIWFILVSRVLAWITHPLTWIIWILRTVEIHWVNLMMMMRWKMFGEITSRIRSYRFTKDVVMSLENYILNPIKIISMALVVFSAPHCWRFRQKLSFQPVCMWKVRGGPVIWGWSWLVHQIWLCETMPPLLHHLHMTWHFSLYWRGR